MLVLYYQFSHLLYEKKSQIYTDHKARLILFVEIFQLKAPKLDIEVTRLLFGNLTSPSTSEDLLGWRWAQHRVRLGQNHLWKREKDGEGKETKHFTSKFLFSIKNRVLWHSVTTNFFFNQQS